jgi:hypothetical protein|tara:strand:- start:521 stop:727 length:207 start_codon:yes stop_codon:yes gene_type:complete
MKIIKNTEAPPASAKKGYTDVVKRMELGDCVEVDNVVDAQGIAVAMRQLGHNPVRRKVYRVWMTECAE